MGSSVFDRPGARGRQRFAAPHSRVSGHVRAVMREITGNAAAHVVLESVTHWPEGFTLHLATFFSAPQKRATQEFVSHPLAAVQDPDGPCLAVHFADGRMATSLDPLEYHLDLADALVLSPNGATGSEHHLRESVYVRPLPPPGPVTVTARWLALDVEEAFIQLDGAEILAGAAEARSWL